MSPPESTGDSAEPNNDKQGVEEPTLQGLGEALAGVTLGNNNKGTSSSFGSSAIAATPFTLSSGKANNNDVGWGNFEPPQISNNATPKEGGGNESLELFLSQSPSQTLGEEVFRFSSHTNLPALVEEDKHSNHSGESFKIPNAPTPTKGGHFGDIRSDTQANPRRRTESPSCSVTGTTTSSRSASPYANASDHGNRSIPAYQRSDSSFDQANNNTNSNTLPTLDPNATNRSPYTQVKLQTQTSNGYEAPASFEPNPRSPAYGMPDPQGQQGGQVLYMAVPSPDGRGQVLQPVQMMQLPGKPYAYVVPPGGVQAQGQADPSMMSLPPIQSNDYSMANQYSIDNSSAGRYDRNDDYKTPYQTDPAIASLYASPQRPPLEALLGQVRRLSRDQVGCRLVQQALDEEGPMAATLILQEGLPFWGEAMVDPFGNYLFQKILEKVTADERVMLVKNVSARLVNASLNLHGTRSVQKIVEVCAQDEASGKVTGEETAAKILTTALTPSAARLCIDSHGNHVIQRILQTLGPVHSQFIFDAVAASVGDVARHRHGCCVIQRCLDSPQNDARMNLVHRIVEKSLELMQDAYGNYVVQYVLDVCSDETVHAVCDSVAGKVNLLAIQKFSSNVMEKCLERCTDRTKEMYLTEISDSDRIRELMMDPFGNYVVQRALSVATHTQAIRLVEAMRPHLISTQTAGLNGQRNGGVRNTAGGRRIIAKICRRFPNFTLNPVGSQDELYSQSKSNHHHHHHQNNRYMNHQSQGMHQSNQSYATYAPIGTPSNMQQQQQPYVSDPRMAQQMGGLPPQQQQPLYGMGGANPGNMNANYYDPGFTGGNYPGF